jgi:hypothetical protein
MDETHGQAYIP